MTTRTGQVRLRTAALVAGVALATMAILAGISYGAFIAPQLEEPGAVDGDVLRLAAAAFVVVAALDVVVAWSLYVLLRPVQRDVALLAAWLRLAYTAIFVGAISHLFAAVQATDPEPSLAAFETLWQLALTFFGLHLAIVGVLVWRAPYIPWLFGPLLLISGAGYLIDGFATMLGTPTSVAQFTFVGEVAIIFWLLIRGRRLAEPTGEAPAAGSD